MFSKGRPLNLGGGCCHPLVWADKAFAKTSGNGGLCKGKWSLEADFANISPTSGRTQPTQKETFSSFLRKLEKAVAVSGVLAGVLEESPRKIPGKLLDNFPESPNATNSRISGTGKGKPAGNLGSTLPGPCPNLPCGVFFEINSSSLLEFF